MTLAQVVRESGNRFQLSLDEIPLPELQPGKALARVKFVAQNPTDGKFIFATSCISV